MTLPVNPNRACGIYPGQGIFAVSNSTNTRGGLLDARESFVGIINNILSQTPATIDRASGIAMLNRSQSITPSFDSTILPIVIPNLIWFRTDYSYGIELPLPYQYASGNNEHYHVYSSTERNALFTNPAFIDGIISNVTLKVWVDTTNSANPAWSIWEINNTIANEYINSVPSGTDVSTILIEYADSIFQVAKAFDVYADTYADMLVLPNLVNGQLIYVNADETADGFWTVYEFNASQLSFTIMQGQAYRLNLSDGEFVFYTDWYAQNISISGVSQSYSASNPPMVTYATESARNLAEGPSPINTFVQISSGVSSWYWTAYDTVAAAWTTVALEQGTVGLSANFYDPTRVVYYPANPVVTNVNNRDGSWEIRVLADILFYEGLLQSIEINETFFSLLHFIHVQQDNVDWAFKTNFMTVAGYQIPLIQSGIATTDISTSLNTYIEEVKPYRVKIRNFEQQYSPAIDQVNAHVTDFDKPVYFDPVLKVYRRLDPNVVADMLIIATNEPWEDWYDQLDIPSISGNFVGDGSTIAFNVGAVGTLLSVIINGVAVQNYTTSVSDVLNITSIIFSSPPALNSSIDVNVSVYSTYAQAVASINNTINAVFTGTGLITSFPIGAAGTILSVMIDDQPMLDYTSSVSANITTITFAIAPVDGSNIEISVENTNDIYIPPVNQIRKLNTTILFDRVTGFETEFSGAYGKDLDKYDSYDGTALDRILNFYIPQAGMPLADPANLMSLNFKGTRTDGGLMSQYTDAASDFDNTEGGFDTTGFDVQVNSGISQLVDGGTLPGPNSTSYQLELNAVSTTDPFGYGLRDPYVEKNNPEERVSIISDDVLNLHITSQALPGAAPQTTKYFDVSHFTDVDTVTLFHGVFAASSSSILVWRDGLRLTTDQYVIDFFGRTVTPNIINADETSASTIVVKVFGMGGSDPIIETDYFAGNGTSNFVISTDNVTQAQLLASINGDVYSAVALEIVENTVTFPIATQTTDDVAIYVFETDSTDFTNFINQENLPYNSDQSWTINYPDTVSIPAHVGVIVEVNGARLLPPLTYYGPMDTTRRFLNFDVIILAETVVQIFVDGEFYPYQIPTVTAGTSTLPFGVMVPNGDLPNNTNGMFAIYGQQLISLDPTFMATEVCLVIHQGNDFEILDSVLTISKPLASTDTIFVSTFSNANLMGIKTNTFLTNGAGEYEMSSPFGADYTWVTLNGSIIVGDVDYSFTDLPTAFSEAGFGENGYDLDSLTNTRVKLTVPINVTTVQNQWIVATVFTLQPAREKISWISTTSTPAAQRMVPQPDTGGFGMMPFGMVGFDQKIDWALAIPPYGAKTDIFGNSVPVPLYNMNKNAWEFLRADSLFGGTLLNPLNPSDNEITISLYDTNVSQKLAPENPFYTPILPPYSLVGNFVGDGVTTSFVVGDVGTLTVLVADVYMVFGTDYLITTTAANTTVIFTIAPALDASIAINLRKITKEVPGVVYIRGERIEYWDIQNNGSEVVLSNIRRATRGTSSCSEQRYVENFTANGVGPYVINAVGNLDIYKIYQAASMSFMGDDSSQTFTVTGIIPEAISSINVTVGGISVTQVTDYIISYSNTNSVSINFVTAPALNSPIIIVVNYYVWLVEQFSFQGNMIGDFTITTTSSTTSITFIESLDTEIHVGVGTGNSIPVGTFVQNGMQNFKKPVPYDQASGNRDIQPIQYIIQG